jgi:imidazolonepropionase
MSGLPVKVYAAGWPNSDAITLTAEFDAVSVTDVNVLTTEEATRLAKTHTIATLLPGKLPIESTAGAAVGRRLIDLGVPVALGSGFVPSTCSTQSMQTVMALACMRMGLSAEEAITAATVNAACACGLAGRCGSLEFGKDADLCILNVSDYREIPLYFGTNLVSSVIRKGVPMFRAGTIHWAENSSNV